MRLFVKADRDYADPQHSFSSSEFEREKQDTTGQLPKLPDLPTRVEKAVISTEKRESLKRKQFALKKKPKEGEAKGSYPIHDLIHARNALARVAQHGSEAEQKTVRSAVYKKYPQLKKRKEEMEKAMHPTNDAIDILKADRLKTDDGYQAAISALVDAGMRQNQLEGWVGVRNLAKSLEPLYGAESEIIAKTVGWEAFQEGALTTGGSSAMIDSLIKACKGDTAEKSATEKAYMGTVKIPTQKPGESKKPAMFTGRGAEPKGAVPGKPTFGVGGAFPSSTSKKQAVSKAVELLMGMAKAKAAEMCPGNPSNEQNAVSGAAHGGIDPGQTSVGGTPHGGSGPAQTSVGGTPHAGRGPAQTSVSGAAHGGISPGQTSVSGAADAGREGNMNKALMASALPRLPRADAMNFDQWRSATRVLTSGNSAFADSQQVQKHYGTGPLTGEVLQQVMADSDERASRHMYSRTPGPVYKSCSSCGRTYNSSVRKSATGEDLGCPSCSVVKSRECAHCGNTMAKSHGGNICCPIHGPA